MGHPLLGTREAGSSGEATCFEQCAFRTSVFWVSVIEELVASDTVDVGAEGIVDVGAEGITEEDLIRLEDGLDLLLGFEIGALRVTVLVDQPLNVGRVSSLASVASLLSHTRRPLENKLLVEVLPGESPQTLDAS